MVTVTAVKKLVWTAAAVSALGRFGGHYESRVSAYYIERPQQLSIDSELYASDEKYEKRRRDLIATLTKDGLGFDITQHLHMSMDTPAITLSTSLGEEMECRLSNDVDQRDSPEDLITTRDNSTAVGSESQATVVSKYSKVLKSFSGRCAVIRTGWWTYEWCHEKEVRQYHIDPETGQVMANWSLGSFTSSEIQFVLPSTAEEEEQQAPVEEVNETENVVLEKTPDTPRPEVVPTSYFEHGQHCEETGFGRKTEVRFYCCDIQRSSPQMFRGLAHETSLVFYSIDEPEICSYVARVCSPHFCLEENDATQSDTSLKGLMKAMNGQCFRRVEGWWTYEFCLHKQVRQFREQRVETADGTVVVLIEADYVLGSMSEEVWDSMNLEDHLVKTEGSGTDFDDHNKMAKLEVEFVNGTVCDETGEHRSSTVVYKCGQIPMLLSVDEDQICHYTVIFTTPHLCKHQDFIREEPPTQRISCKPKHAQAATDQSSSSSSSSAEIPPLTTVGDAEHALETE